MSFLIPLRVGEVTKSVYLHTQLGLPLGKTFLWIFIDRFLDFWVTLILVALLILIVNTNLPSNFGLIILLILAIFSLATVIILLSSKWAKKLLLLFSPLFYFKKVRDVFERAGNIVIESFDILKRNPLELAVLIVLTILAAVSDGLIWYFILISLGVNFDFLKIFLGNLLSALTFIIPAAPGYVGTVEASALAIFSGVLGIEANLVSAGAVLGHILTALIILIYGVIAIYFLKFDLSLVWKKVFRR